MVHVLITGMSGVGKSTVLAELACRGHATIDTDYDGWVLADGTWDEQRIGELLASTSSVIVSGTVANQGRFYDQFSAVVMLSAPLEILIERVAQRTDNPYGRSEEDQAEIREYVREIEPLLRDGATVELDGRLPVSALADDIEQLIDRT
jgi:shikimate kinase